jgi:hypothetical protein
MALGLGVTRDGGELSVLDPRNRPLALVDTKTFRVSDPAAAQAGAADGDSGISPSLWLAGVALGASIGAFVLILRRRRTVAPT